MHKWPQQIFVVSLLFLMMIWPIASVAQFQSPIVMQSANPPATFGFSVASADVNADDIADVIAGSIFSSVGGAVNAGQVFLFFGGPVPHTSPDLVLQSPNPQAEARFGWSLTVGDVNGDGEGDIVVGEPFRNRGADKYVGAAYVFFGGNLLDNQADVVLQAPASLDARAAFSWSVAAGDINGDGADEVIVGAYNVKVGGSEEAGQVFIFEGSHTLPGVLNYTYVLQSPTPHRGGDFGWAVATGNVNGDAFADVIVGAPNDDAGSVNNAGRAYVYFGSSSFDTISDGTLQQTTPVANSSFGYAVSSGDLNRDGKDEVIVSAPRPDFSQFAGGSKPGEVYIFPGGNPFVGSPTKIQAPNPAKNDRFGDALSTGDIDNDGARDLLVGMPLAEVSNKKNAGQAFLFLGGTSFDATADFTFQEPSPSSGEQFGYAIALADVSGDRRADAVISAPALPTGTFGGFPGAPGKVLVFLSQ